VSFIGICILGGYSYVHKDLRSEAAADSPLTSSLDTTAVTLNSGSQKAAEDIAFLEKLDSLTKIKIDVSLFADKAFGLLVNNKIKLEPIPFGRVNPFSPTSKTEQIVKPVISLSTDPATLITTKSAVLNGSLSGATTTNIYFEYGIDQTLGKVTPKVMASLTGTFASNLTLLNSGTNYFFRAVANINGSMYYGEIISFSTN
jgi:hypothetical protein